VLGRNAAGTAQRCLKVSTGEDIKYNSGGRKSGAISLAKKLLDAVKMAKCLSKQPRIGPLVCGDTLGQL